MGFCILENTCRKPKNTNEAVNTDHDVSTASSQGQASSSTYADDVMFSFFANHLNSPIIREVTFLENAGAPRNQGIEMEMLQEDCTQWRLMQMPWVIKHEDNGSLCQIRKIPRSPTRQCPIHLRIAVVATPLDFVPELMYPEYIPQEDEILSAEEQLLPAVASPIADPPRYVLESDLEEEAGGGR
ncbi:hypothetical protein Tco_1191970 [Tanacetum coccineum]